ncbi:MAG TPA: phytanoyl-CoA dioxygenase family protein [Candidatus Binatia bacterium]|nr:phytanoyl-CoA dioxygenase family protein [Candidatus Binatia bacterium]
MRAELRRLPATAPAEDAVRILSEDGGLIVEDLIDARAIAAINADVDPWVSSADPAMRHLNPAIQIFFGDRTKHVGGLAGKSRTFATRVMIHPTFLGICDAILNPSCARYQLNLAHLIVRGPGADNQYLHRDEDVWNLLPRPHPEIQVASIVALVDFDAANGATRVIPGSHRWDRNRYPAPDEIADAEMRAGSAVVYLGSTMHGGGANATADSWRRGVHISYTLGWLRTEENNYLAVPPELARELPRECQEVLGYAVHDAIEHGGGYLGMVALRDPIELLDRDELAATWRRPA